MDGWVDRHLLGGWVDDWGNSWIEGWVVEEREGGMGGWVDERRDKAMEDESTPVLISNKPQGQILASVLNDT